MNTLPVLDPNGLAIYLHWPFSCSIPPYCDFHSVVRPRIDTVRWLDALRRDFSGQARAFLAQPVHAVFIGGGTPSLLDAHALADLLTAMRTTLPFAENAQVTLEADPEPAMIARFPAYAAAGVTRLSLRVGSLDRAGLRFMGHERWDAATARCGIDAALACFAQVSVDLFYGWPGQSVTAWLAELEAALARGLRHVSIYDLTPLPGTLFSRLDHTARLPLAQEEARAAMFIEGTAALRARGLPPYEIANFAVHGEENRYNIHAWRGGSYLGVGPGAIGRSGAGATRKASAGTTLPEAWLYRIEHDQPAGSVTALSAGERLDEILLWGLRLADGLTWDWAARALGQAVRPLLDSTTVARLVAEGLLIEDAHGLRLTESGWPLADDVTLRLAATAFTPDAPALRASA